MHLTDEVLPLDNGVGPLCPACIHTQFGDVIAENDGGAFAVWLPGSVWLRSDCDLGATVEASYEIMSFGNGDGAMK